MLCGLIRLASKIKYWLTPKVHARCRCFCPLCEYYYECSSDEADIKEALEEIEGEEIEYI